MNAINVFLIKQQDAVLLKIHSISDVKLTIFKQGVVWKVANLKKDLLSEEILFSIT